MARFFKELTIWEVKMLSNLLAKTDISIEALKLLFKLPQSPNLVERSLKSDLLVKKAKKKILLGHWTELRFLDSMFNDESFNNWGHWSLRVTAVNNQAWSLAVGKHNIFWAGCNWNSVELHLFKQQLG